jgi:hypothetical protein
MAKTWDKNKESTKDKVPFRFTSKGYDKTDSQEYIEMVDGGSEGYDDGKEFFGRWWETFPPSNDYGDFGFKQPVDGNPIRKDAFDDTKLNGVTKDKYKDE